jgi:hypothetical protein
MLISGLANNLPAFGNKTWQGKDAHGVKIRIEHADDEKVVQDSWGAAVTKHIYTGERARIAQVRHQPGEPDTFITQAAKDSK